MCKPAVPAHSHLCSYIWSGDGLRRVPASRADIFRDRSLGLADKRALMATITACMEAHEHGRGRWVVRVAKNMWISDI